MARFRCVAAAALVLGLVCVGGCERGGGGRELANASDDLTTCTAGRTTVGASAGTFNLETKYVNSVSFSEAVSVGTLTLYVDGLAGTTGSTLLRAVVYAADGAGGNPGTLLGTSYELTVSAGQAGGWQSLAFPSAVSVGAGTYWMGVIAGGSSRVARDRYDVVTGAVRNDADTYADGPSNPYGTATTANAAISMYVTYTLPGVAGTTSVGANTGRFNLNTKYVNAITVAEGVDVQSLRLYVDGQGGTSGSTLLEGVVYAADGASGNPGTLLGTSSQLTVSAGQALAWQALAFSTPLTLGAGTYWIGVIAGGTTAVARDRYDIVTGAVRNDADAYSDGPSNPYGTATTANARISMYAAYSRRACGTAPPPPPPSDGGTGGTDSGSSATDAGSDAGWMDPPPSSTDRYVSASAPAGGTGTLTSPFNTIAACASAVLAGQTCWVRSGTYYDSAINPARSGDATHPITFAAYPGEHPVLDGRGTAERAFSVSSRSYIRVRGFEVRNYAGRSMVFWGTSYAVIERNVVHDLKPDTSGHVLGIYLTNNVGSIVQNNLTYDLHGANESFGILTDGYQRDVVIRRNLGYFIDKSAIRVTCPSTTGESTTITVEGNIGVHNAYAGIEVNSCWATGHVYVRNNFVGWNGAYGFHPKHNDHVVLEHNTVVYNQLSGDESAGGSDAHSSCNHHELRGNIFSNDAQGIYFQLATYNLHPVLEYTDYWNHGVTSRMVYGGTTWYTSLSSLQSATTFEDHGIVADPLFVDPAHGDFRLQSGSPARGSAHDGGDRGAQASVLSGVGPDASAGLGAIPMLTEIPLTVAAFSSETSSGRATNVVDRFRESLWIPVTTASEWVDLDLPGTEPMPLSRFALIRHAHESSNNPRDFDLYVQPSAGAAWARVSESPDPFTAYWGAAGRIWRLPASTQAVRVKLVLVNNHGGSRLELSGFRLY